MLTEATGECMVAKEQYSGELLFSNILKESMVKKSLCWEIAQIRIHCWSSLLSLMWYTRTPREHAHNWAGWEHSWVLKAANPQSPKPLRRDMDPCSSVPTAPWLEQRSGSLSIAVSEHRQPKQCLLAADCSLSKEGWPGCVTAICYHW